MKLPKTMKHAAGASLALVAGLTLSSVSGASAFALANGVTTADTGAARISAIKTAGDKEISRRLTTLNTLSGKINAATHLNASDKAALSSEVSSEISGLTALKTKLDAETSLDATKADAQSIYTDYRVYALLVPKIELVKVADDQQVVEGKLTDLATKLQTRLTTAKNAGKDTAALQAKLDDMTSQTKAAQAISSGIESKVIGLQPSDYDSDHSVLSGDRDQLKSARADNQAAAADAKAIVAGLQGL